MLEKVKNCIMNIHPPTIVSIETTTACPASCIMCPRKEVLARRRNPIMPPALVYRIVDMIDFPCLIQWCWINEPLADPRIFEYIDYANKQGKHGWINTNAWLLDKPTARKALESGLEFINIPIDSLDPLKYEKSRLGLKYERVIANIEGLIALKKELQSPTRIQIAMVDIKGFNDGEFPKLKEIWQDKVDLVHQPLYRKRGGDWDNRVGGETPKKTFCFFIENEMNITVDGDVPLCACDALVDNCQGNVLSKNLIECWDTLDRQEAIKKIRSQGLASLGYCQELER